jgi:hypothetical protein
LIADLQLGSIPLDARRSGDLVPPPPTPPPLFRSGKIAIALQGADFDAARLLDCASPASPVPAHIEILWKFWGCRSEANQ